MRQTLAGNRNAFGWLVKRYERPVYHFLLAYTAHPEAAQDLTQESFLKAYERLPTLQDPKKFAGWLWGIARNLSRTWRRSPAQRPTASLHHMMEQGWEGPVQETSPSLQEQQERSRLLAIAMERLDEDDRALLALRYLKGHDLTDLQEVFHLNASALKMRLKRAREKLAAHLQKAGAHR